MDSIYDRLEFLCKETTESDYIVEGDILTDCLVIDGRRTLLNSLLSVFWFWSNEKKCADDRLNKFIQDFLHVKKEYRFFVWGEAAIPKILSHIWYLRRIDSTKYPDDVLFYVLTLVIKSSLDSKNGLASPYYDLEDVLRSISKSILPNKVDPMESDSFQNSSFSALPLLHLLVRTNLKQSCKILWPDFSKLGLRHFKPEKPWMFCLFRSPKGIEITEQPKLTKNWDELVLEARNVSPGEIPKALFQEKCLLLLFIIIFPHRATPPVIRFLGRQFNRSWFIGDPID